MIVSPVRFALLAAALAASLPIAAAGQTVRESAVEQPQAEALPTYRPPPRGAPGGRVGGASRGTFLPVAPLPTIELLAPRDHTGLTASATPVLYFYVSGPLAWPTRFTISAPGRAPPVLETPIATPAAAGIYRLDVAAYGVRLEPDIVYTWSVSAILDPRRRAHDIVASATLSMRARARDALEAGAATAPLRRAALWARDGLWYDAVAAAAAASDLDRHAGLDALMNEVGLAAAADFDRRAAALRVR